MHVLNDSAVENLFVDLYKQFTVLGSKNVNINAKRSLYFQKRCNLLNEYVNIPNGYCKFLWDGITCYNYTAPYTTVKSQCVSWPMDAFPPSDAFVERRCLDGTWENISTRTLEMLYKNCKVIPFSLDYTTSDNSLNMGTRYIALTGYCFSAIALFLAFLVFILLKKLKCGRNWIHFNLFISFFLRFIFCTAEFIHAMLREDPEKRCLPFNIYDGTFGEKLFILGWNYNIITSYFWVFIEGLYLHNSIYFNVFHESSTIPYVLFGWVIPLLIIAALGIFKALFDNTRYWLAHCDERISWIIRGPLVAISIAELVITVNIMRQLYSKVQNENYLNERERYRKFAKSFFYLLLGVGGTYFIFDIVLYCVTFMDKSNEIMIHRAYIINNSLWGIVIAYIYCFNNADIRLEIQQKCKKIKQNMANFGFDFKQNLFIAALCPDIRHLNVKLTIVICPLLLCLCFWLTLSNDETCKRHAKSPLISLSNSGTKICSECLLSKKLLELKNFSNPGLDTNYCSTLCSTIDNSEQNTLQLTSQRAYPRVTYLSFCREEADEIVDNDL